LEEKGRFAVGIMAHLARMGGIIAADAINAVNGKAVLRPGDGN
jgi:hypothetical protein